LIIFEGALGDGKEFKLDTEVTIVPEDNTQLSGFYKSGPMYCSQCEAEGFRRITYYPDRPDNMATFKSVKITADKGKYPVLLSNGNLVEEVKDAGGGKVRGSEERGARSEGLKAGWRTVQCHN